MALEEKIEKAVIKIIETEIENGDFPTNRSLLQKLKLTNQFTRIYPFTTENIKGYLEQYDLTDQKVLTVGASGDHILNLILLGATKIDYFDINPFTEFFVELKIAAVKALEYVEFLQYFCADDWDKIDCFNSRAYRKISPHLKGDTRTFWDSLYLEFTGRKIRFSNLFSRDESPSRILADINPYLEKEKYYQLKKQLLQNQYQLHFYEENLKDLPRKLKKSYDKILLSNIGKNLYYMYNGDIELDSTEFYLKEFQNNIFKLSSHVVDGGIIFVVYLYHTKKDDVIENKYYIVYDTYAREKYFPTTQYQLVDFMGVGNFKYNNQEKDSVLIYQKKN